MTRLFYIQALIGMLVALAGCRSATAPSWYKNDWHGYFSYADAQRYLDEYRNVILVCITEDHVEDLDPKRPDSWSVLCFKGTVVKSYKGGWTAGEKVAFAHALDGKVAKESNLQVGTLMFLFTDAHTDTRFGLNTGDFENYLPETDRLLQSLFHKTAKP
jgi:hypothetical protein